MRPAAVTINLLISLALAALAYLAVGALASAPWPALAAAAVFVLYWVVGIAIIIIDLAWFD